MSGLECLTLANLLVAVPGKSRKRIRVLTYLHHSWNTGRETAISYQSLWPSPSKPERNHTLKTKPLARVQPRPFWTDLSSFWKCTQEETKQLNTLYWTSFLRHWLLATFRLFFCVFIQIYKNTQKKEIESYLAILTEQASLLRIYHKLPKENISFVRKNARDTLSWQ